MSAGKGDARRDNLAKFRESSYWRRRCRHEWEDVDMDGRGKVKRCRLCRRWGWGEV